MPLDCAGYLDLFEDEATELPPSLSVSETAIESEGAPAPALSLVENEEEWKNDPVPVKLEKIRAAFLNSKTVSEVLAAGSMMMIGDWLELVVKLSPKNVQITGGLSFKHMLEELGPINKDDYRPKQIECRVEDTPA